MNKPFYILLVFFISVYHSNAQMTFEQWEDSLIVMLDITRKTESVPKMEAHNQEFSQTLEKVIMMEGAFAYPFPKLSTRMSTLTSPDNAFRIFNWNVEDSYKEHNFYCLLLQYNEKEETYFTTEFKDNYRYIFSPDTKSLDHTNWYGALYYEIIPIQSGGKTVYTLLGWNGFDRSSSKKVIEAMTLEKNRIKFGSSIFKYGKEMKRRVVFEFSNETTMSMKYLKKKKEQKIVFDHLAPQSPQVEGIYSFYFPDLSFDALVLEGNKWILVEDIEMTIKTPKGFNDPR